MKKLLLMTVIFALFGLSTFAAAKVTEITPVEGRFSDGDDPGDTSQVHVWPISTGWRNPVLRTTPIPGAPQGGRPLFSRCAPVVASGVLLEQVDRTRDGSVS